MTTYEIISLLLTIPTSIFGAWLGIWIACRI